jgi:geranylgeranyl transferase type-1 subunit beta
LKNTLHWLASRQTATLEDDDGIDTFDDETDTSNTCHDAHSFVKVSAYPTTSIENTTGQQPKVPYDLAWVGMNGRCNKIADTCYAYWVSTPLQILGRMDIISPKPIRRYLLDKTQHAMGGFGKVVDDPPDMYHSFLGMMVLAMFGEPGLQNVDAALCITDRAKRHLESLPWRKEAIASIKRNGVNGAGETGMSQVTADRMQTDS